jgi:hypothetical protein
MSWAYKGRVSDLLLTQAAMSLASGIVYDLASLSALTKAALSIMYRIKSSTPETTLARARTYLHKAVTILHSSGDVIPSTELEKICRKIRR